VGIRTLQEPPSAIDFLRNFVWESQPVIIRNGMNDWPARKWTIESLTEHLKDTQVEVNLTPSGRGDAIHSLPDGELVFVEPTAEKMAFKEFANKLKERTKGEVHYLSEQNDNLRKTIGVLADEYPKCINFAREAFDNDPDAVNLWVGDDRSTTTCHKDHYENMYAVCSGSKIFTLCPPADYIYLNEK
jgi:peptidyl-lysine (3S)-dioxygenase / protease